MSESSPMWLSIAVATIAIVTLVFTALSLRSKAGIDLISNLKDEIESLNRRLDECEDNHRDCERERRTLRIENANLMRRALGFGEDC